MYIILKTWKLH